MKVGLYKRVHRLRSTPNPITDLFANLSVDPIGFPALQPPATSGERTGRFHSDRGIELEIEWTASAQLCDVCVRPERIEVESRGYSDSTASSRIENQLHGVVRDVIQLGADVYFIAELANGQTLTTVEKNMGRCVIERGQAVTLKFRVEDCIVLPRM